MKTDQDSNEPGITPGNTLPTPLSRDHTYFSIPADYSYTTATWHSNHDYSSDVTTGRKEKTYSDLITEWNSSSNVRTESKPQSDVIAERNSRGDVISSTTETNLSSMTYTDITKSGNSSCDAITSGKPPQHANELGETYKEAEANRDVRNINNLPESGPKNNAGDTFNIFTDSKDTASPYGMLIDEEVIESFLSQAKAVKEPPRSDSRMKLDTRYRTNSSDSAFSEDSLLDDDQDSKLETLINQFIFNQTNDFTEYVETNQNNNTADHVDVDGLDVTDLFNSAAMFGPDLADPSFAAAERESGMGSSENSICSDNHDASPVKRYKASSLHKHDSISSLSSSSTSSSASASSSSSPSSSTSLSLSFLSLDALSSPVAKSSQCAQRFDGLHSVTSVPTGENNEVWEQSSVCGDRSVTVSLQARDSEMRALSPAISESARSSSSVASSEPCLTRERNFDDQREDTTGFITLPAGHLSTTQTTTTINNTISHSSSNNSISSINNNNNSNDDDKDNYDFIFSHLRNGFQPSFEIRGDDSSDLMLDEPDFVDFPFPTHTQNCRPFQHDTPISPKKGMGLNDTSNRAESVAGFPSYESNARRDKSGVLMEGGDKVLDGNLATSAMYLAKSPQPETSDLAPNNDDYFNDYFGESPKRDVVEDCYSSAVSSQSPFLDWFSMDDSQIDSSINGSSLTAGLNMSEIYEPNETKHCKSDDQGIVELSDTLMSAPKSSLTDISQNISQNTSNVRGYSQNSGVNPNSVRLLCSVKKCTTLKRPVQTRNLNKNVPNKKKSLSQCKTLPVSDENTLKVHCHKPNISVNRVPILGAPKFNQTKCNESKNVHSNPRIEILSWDDAGSIHVKVPKLSIKNKESRNPKNRVTCSLLREALTAEEPHPRFLGSMKQGKHKNTKSKLYRNESPGLLNETLTGETSASVAENSGSSMSELEKYLRGIIPTEPASEGRNKTNDSQYFDDTSDVSFLRKLLTGEMSTHAYREIDKRICEKKRLEIK